MYKVIVIEDETMVRRGIVLTTDWAALGCVVVGEAANGEEGLEIAGRLSPDIIVTDVKMPRMDGVEMITRLRGQGSRSKFIILTAHSDFKYAQSALKLGVSDYLLKPLKDGDLEQAIRNILDQLEERRHEAGEESAPILSFYPPPRVNIPKANTWMRRSVISRNTIRRRSPSAPWRIFSA